MNLMPTPKRDFWRGRCLLAAAAWHAAKALPPLRRHLERVLRRRQNALCARVAELVRDVASRYPCKCSADGTCIVSCDAQLISRALANLIENAVRHSGSDDISVTLSRRGGMAEIAVEDHGVGVPPEEAERIFERFHRVDPARAAETGGAGLGLAIVRRTARLHGGDVTLSSAVPRGSRFVLSLRGA
jgi:signal transduction histidine kinase